MAGAFLIQVTLTCFTSTPDRVTIPGDTVAWRGCMFTDHAIGLSSIEIKVKAEVVTGEFVSLAQFLGSVGVQTPQSL